MHTKWILYGGFTAGIIDIIYPTTKTVMAGGSPLRPWLGVAGGLLGPAAREGGAGIAMLGVFLHLLICVSAAFVFYFIVRRLPWFVKQWLAAGVVFGFGFLLVMNYVILPLSRIGKPLYAGEGFLWAIVSHVLMIGLPIAFFVTRGIRKDALQDGAPGARALSA
jgi:hypothetical protein